MIRGTSLQCFWSDLILQKMWLLSPMDAGCIWILLRKITPTSIDTILETEKSFISMRSTAQSIIMHGFIDTREHVCVLTTSFEYHYWRRKSIDSNDNNSKNNGMNNTDYTKWVVYHISKEWFLVTRRVTQAVKVGLHVNVWAYLDGFLALFGCSGKDA